MSEKMIPLEGETQKKRVVRPKPVFILPRHYMQMTDGSLGVSATFSTQISEASTMVLGIRMLTFYTYWPVILNIFPLHN